MNEGSQGISAEDIYDAVRSGKSAMVVSRPSAEEHGGKEEGGVEINIWREGGAEGGMCNEKRNKAPRANNERDYHLLSVADWCDPAELALIREKEGVFSLGCVVNDWQHASIPTIVVLRTVSSG